MKLGTAQAEATIRYYLSKGFSKKEAEIITKSNNHKEKQIFECLFEHKRIFPNYQVGEGRRGKYNLNFDLVVSLLDKEGIKYYTGNISPRGGQLGYFVAIDENIYKRILNKDPEIIYE